MIDIEKYISDLIKEFKSCFEERLIYVGLQGSYLRGEANDESDIDIMTVIDGLSVSDLQLYRSIIESMPYADKSCGFICSREDLMHWNPLEMFHLLYSTEDRYGKLADLIPSYSTADIRNFVKMSINNMYHELCHRYIHGDQGNTAAALPAIFKGVFFILQDKYFLTHGEFYGTKIELLKHLEGSDRAVLERSIDLKTGQDCAYEDSFQILFTWCQETLSSL